MTAFRNNAEQRHEGFQPNRLTSRQLVLLNITLDFLLDAGQHKTLKEAVAGTDPLDLMRLLVQQWHIGLSTLSGDLNYQHSVHLKPAVAAQFIEGVKEALLTDTNLGNLPGDPKTIYDDLVRYMAKNQPHHAAWCAAMLWQRPQISN